MVKTVKYEIKAIITEQERGRIEKHIHEELVQRLEDAISNKTLDDRYEMVTVDYIYDVMINEAVSRGFLIYIKKESVKTFAKVERLHIETKMRKEIKKIKDEMDDYLDFYKEV